MICAALRILCWLLCTGLVLVAMGCRGFLQPSTPPAERVEGVPKQLLAQQVIVTLASASAEQWARMAATLSQMYDLPQVGAFPLASIGVQCIVFQLPEDRSMAEVLTQLEADPLVESVQRNQFFHGQRMVHNDPYATLQYGVQAVRADRVHQVATGKGVKVAVIDTGVEVAHPDLHGRVIDTANFVAGGEQTFTQERHGTAIAGVIAARADNDIGILGVAPEAELLALKACWQPTSKAGQALCSSWTLAKATDFAVRAGADILNFSLAGPSDPLMARLLATATERGITVVAATKLSSHGPGFPASLDSVIAVLASDPAGHVHLPAEAEYPPLLAAPGVDILTTVPRQTYDFMTGSSLAAAHVSGIAALLIEQHPTLSPAQLHTLLQTTARPVDGTPGTTTVGIVDICAALRKMGHPLTCS